MPELPAKPAPKLNQETLNVHNAVLGLHRRDLLSTLRQLALHSVKQPLHSARHVAALGTQLGRILLGDKPYPGNPKDARFKDPSWQHNPFYQRTLQSYLAFRQQLSEWVDDSQLDAPDRARAHFVLNLLADALAPSNSPLNPQVIKELFNTGGSSLLRGFNHFYDDLVNNHGMPSQVSKHAFEVGRNLATSSGAVVFRNELLELIQYKPITEKQYATPLLIVPPQINKFYIFDLSHDKSLVQYALKHDLRTFIVSWRNPDPRHREWGLSSYVQALEEAVDACLQITGSKSLNLLGACAGGLTSAALQGHLQAKRKLRKVNSATYMVSLLDSQIDTPPMLFADEQSLEAAKRRSYQHGVLDGREMAQVFAWMRPNELVWNYWINNYLLGKQPPAFDILYWNNDNTRLPAALHGELLDFFTLNPLTRAGALEVCGTPVDLSKVKVDSFTVAGSNDHITPWDAVYRSALLLGGKREFVLANSGHIQSILNPPGHPKAAYRHGHNLSSDPRAWYHGAEEVKGSWWPTWLNWLQARSGELSGTQLTLGSSQYPALDAAPGTYVHVR